MLHLKLYVYLLLSYTLGISASFAQEVVTAAGGFFNIPDGSISWTLGEPISESFSANQQIFSQGFQQSAQNYASIPFISNTDLIEIFPNPFEEIIHLQIQTNEYKLTVVLYDEKMALVETNIITGFYNKSTLTLTNVEAGIYFLHVYSENGKVNSMQKLVKKTL